MAVRAGVLRSSGRPADDEPDPVGHGGEPLVQPAGMVDEVAAERAHRHDAQADLVGDQHHRPGQRRQTAASSPRPQRPASRSASSRLVSHRVRQSTRTARSGARLRRQRRGQLQRRLDRAPATTAPRAVVTDARRHLAVERLRGGDVDRLQPGLQHQRLGVRALARAGAAQDRRSRRAGARQTASDGSTVARRRGRNRSRRPPVVGHMSALPSLPKTPSIRDAFDGGTHARTGTDLPAHGAVQRRADRHRAGRRQCGRGRHRRRRPAGGAAAPGDLHRRRAWPWSPGSSSRWSRRSSWRSSGCCWRAASCCCGWPGRSGASCIRAATPRRAPGPRQPRAPKTMRSAIVQVAVADISMSLDNVLAVAGAARDHPYIMIFGLVLSIALMAVAAQLIARLIDRHRWIAYVGLGIVLFVAGKMIWEGGTGGAAARRRRRLTSDVPATAIRPRRGCAAACTSSRTNGREPLEIVLEPRRPDPGRAVVVGAALSAQVARGFEQRRRPPRRRPAACAGRRRDGPPSAPLQARRRGPRAAARAWRLIGMRRPVP